MLIFILLFRSTSAYFLSPAHHTYIKKGLLVLLLLVLSLGILQDLFQFKKVHPLHGYFPPSEDTSFTFKGWLSGRFQSKRESYLSMNLRLKPDLIRLHNSLELFLFHTSDVPWVVFGKQHQLMDLKQVTSYLGADTLSPDVIKRKTRYIRLVQDTLQKLGKSFYILIPPNKPSVYPEYIPNNFAPKNTTNNYELFTTAFRNNNIRYIDFVAYFRECKEKGVPSLFPHGGTHWNEHGATLALQYLVKEVSKMENKVFPSISMEKNSWEKEQHNDLDILTTMNLLKINIRDTALYPVVKISGVPPPGSRTLFISDSFFDFWIEKGIYDLFDSATYYFYNDRVILKDRTVTEIKYSAKEMLAHFDLIMVLCNESNLDDLGWGGIEKLYFYFYPNDPYRIYDDKEYRRVIIDYMKMIRQNKEWYTNVQEKALTNKISFDKQLYLDAVWALEQENTASGN